MDRSLRWRLGVLAAVAMMLLALYPQLTLWATRGSDWNGAYAYNDIDEVAYAAYLQALIEGRPRRNDPYTGRDDRPGSPQPESLFSIQFIPPYALALTARALNLSGPVMMIVLACLAALAATLALFWLISMVTGDARQGASGALVVLCLGALACGQGAILQLAAGGVAYPYFPFLRRYLPAVPFPVFFIFCGLVWRLMQSETKRARYALAVGASAAFAVLVYSYFYLWTTAAAWLGCLTLMLLLAKPDGWRQSLKGFAVTGALALAALLPYSVLLSHRATTMDSVQLLTLTHAPDPFRPPELIGLVVFASLALAARRGLVSWTDRATLCAASLALTPVLVFNQQTITGRSLQPIHYEVFIANYVALLACVLAARQLRGALKRARLPRHTLAYVALLAFSWGLVEARITSGVLDEQNVIRDEAMPVNRRLAELAKESAAAGGEAHPVVLATNLIQGDELPVAGPPALLWARHLHVFSGAGWEESKERFYQHLYYAGADDRWLEWELNNRDFVVVIALFGWGRNHDRLTTHSAPLTQREIIEEVDQFSAYITSFDRERAANPTLSYVVAYTQGAPDFSNLDRWYERDAGEQLGKFTLYRVRLKSE